MLLRACAIWFVLLVLAVLNGVVRDVFLAPRCGERIGHWISTATLGLVILLVARLWIGWLNPKNTYAAWLIGVVWVALTVAFEFLAGHYLFGNTWATLLGDYNVLRGRVWILVLLTCLVAPAWAARTRGL